MDGWIDGRMDGWTDGWRDEAVKEFRQENVRGTCGQKLELAYKAQHNQLTNHLFNTELYALGLICNFKAPFTWPQK